MVSASRPLLPRKQGLLIDPPLTPGSKTCSPRCYMPPQEKWIASLEIPGSPPAWQPLPEQSVEYRLLPVFFQSSPWRDSSLPAQVSPFSACPGEGIGIWALNHKASELALHSNRARSSRGLSSQRATQRPRRIYYCFQFTNGKCTTVVRKWKAL